MAFGPFSVQKDFLYPCSIRPWLIAELLWAGAINSTFIMIQFVPHKVTINNQHSLLLTLSSGQTVFILGFVASGRM